MTDRGHTVYRQHLFCFYYRWGFIKCQGHFRGMVCLPVSFLGEGFALARATFFFRGEKEGKTPPGTGLHTSSMCESPNPTPSVAARHLPLTGGVGPGPRFLRGPSTMLCTSVSGAGGNLCVCSPCAAAAGAVVVGIAALIGTVRLHSAELATAAGRFCTMQAHGIEQRNHALLSRNQRQRRKR